MNKRWLIKENPDNQTMQFLAQKLQIDPILSNLLTQRGINNFHEAQAFFRPKLEALHDPFLMKNMNQAVERLQNAITQQEKVLLFGDYDVDGTTAVAVLWNILSPLLKGLDYYIPDRYREGYGISKDGIDFAKSQGFKVIIALDCGIKANTLVDYAKSLNIDFIICDHHEPGSNIPDAIVLDPKQIDCPYPFKELSGCGVGFKLMQALFIIEKWNFEILYRQLDLLAISIAADLVPVVGENRIFCHFGLEIINKSPRLCFQEMLIEAKKQLPLTLTNVVFIIAPRINAAGRIDEGKKAVKLMISEDRNEIRTTVKSIEDDNIERRKLDKIITEEALNLLKTDSHFHTKMTTVVFQADWHKGVIGIVASRLIEQYYRPTIVLTESNNKLTGSARSILGINIYEVLAACEDHLEQFGGHAFAAGMTLNPEKLIDFTNQFEIEVQKRISPAEMIPIQEVDHELLFDDLFKAGENIYEIPKFKRILKQLEPHGPENMKPVFVSKNVYVENVQLLKELHLKLSLSQPHCPLEIQAIGFNLKDKIDLALSKEPLDILYTLEINSWNNQERLQLNLKDIRPSL